VIACATLFPPTKTGRKNYDLFCFLAEQMCDLSTRSRIYCSYAVIEPVAAKSELPELVVEDKQIVSPIMQRKAAVVASPGTVRSSSRNAIYIHKPIPLIGCSPHRN
jgi:hypothetical protein